jgi:hypothetical protein
LSSATKEKGFITLTPEEHLSIIQLRNSSEKINFLTLILDGNDIIKGSVLLEEPEPGPLVRLFLPVQVLTLNPGYVFISLGTGPSLKGSTHE